MTTPALKEQALAKLLQDTLALLDGVAESFWSSRIRSASAGTIDPVDVLSWFGGMGSFNDLVIAGVNGHQVREEDEANVNRQLDDFRTSIYDLATQLKA